MVMYVIYILIKFNYCVIILHKIMRCLCIKHEHSHMSLKKEFHPFEYLKY
jgi:hypothetical protein